MSGSAVLKCLLWCLCGGLTAAQHIDTADLVQQVTDKTLQSTDTKLLIILIDGLRWDAINTSHTQPCEDGFCTQPGSYFTDVQRDGATAAWNTPVFPTNALSNIYTISTGVLPAYHGVLGLPEQGWILSEHAIPLWNTASRHGKRVALLRAVGCDANTEDKLVTCIDRINLQGIDNLLVQLTGDAAMAAEMIVRDDYDIVMMRTDLVSWASKHHGPTVDILQFVLGEIKSIFDAMFKEIRDADMWAKTNIVITSTNGLVSTSPSVSKVLTLEDCLSELETQPVFRYHSAGSAILKPCHNTTTQQVIDKLAKCKMAISDDELMPSGAIYWYTRAELPVTDQWPGSDDEILVVLEQGFVLQLEQHKTYQWQYDADSPLHLAHADAADQGEGTMAGSGYQTKSLDMRGVLIAKGREIEAGTIGPAVLQTDVYQLLCHLADLQPVTHQGQWDSVAWMQQSSAASAKNGGATVGICAVLLLLLWLQ